MFHWRRPATAGLLGLAIANPIDGRDRSILAHPLAMARFCEHVLNGFSLNPNGASGLKRQQEGSDHARFRKADRRTHRPRARRCGAQQQCGRQRSLGGRQGRQAWREHVNQALAVLHTMREPDEDMAAAGDPDVWRNMVEAAIAERVD